MAIPTLDKRFDRAGPIPDGALDPDVGFPRDNRYLVLGVRLTDPADDRDGPTRRVNAALRGKRNAVIVQSNFGVDGWAEIEA